MTKTKRSPSPSQLSARQIAETALEAAIDQKALDVRGFFVEKLTDVADYFVIASGTSQRHVRGIADKVLERLKAQGEPPLTVAGYEAADWALLDFGNVVVHVFFEPVRQFYDLDSLWSEAPELEIPEHLHTAAKKLRTGIFA